MLIVQKYGGTSVADVERIKKVADYVVETANSGKKVVVVVSAMAGETDRLLKLGHDAMGNFVCDREMDALVATGEITTASLLAMAINSLGKKAVSLSAVQVPIMTDSEHQRARMKYIETDRINKELKEGKIVVVEIGRAHV